MTKISLQFFQTVSEIKNMIQDCLTNYEFLIKKPVNY